MNLKSKFAGIATAGVLALSLGGAAIASSPDQAVITLDITPGTQLSVVVDSALPFYSQPFTLGNSSPYYSTSYYYTVTDLRGTGAGWTVSASTAGFEDASNTPIPGQALHSSNLQWPPINGVLSSDLNSIET